MALRDESHQDSSTKKILDYYEKYTQNTNLSKYFSGAGQCSPIADIPIKKNDQNTVKFTIATATPITPYSFGNSFCPTKSIDNILDSSKTGEISSNKNISSHSPPAVHISPSDNTKVIWDDRDSPLDDKKLEWDSGADIGYHIVQSNEEKKPLRKCVSLPVLHNLRDLKLNIDTTDLTSALDLEPCLGLNDLKIFIDSSTPDSTSKGTSLNKDLSESSTTATGVTSNDIKQAFSSNTASNSSSQRSKAKLSSECSSNSEESKLLDFKMTLSYLKEKVGLPAAHSTPNIQPSLQHNDIELEENTATSKSLYIKKKGVNMPITNQPLLPKNDSEFKSVDNMEQNDNTCDNISKPVTKMPNKRVIELTISEPISINWTSSDIIDKNKFVEEHVLPDKTEPKLNPKLQIENIFQLELKANKKPSKENKHISTFFEHSTEKTASKIFKNHSKASSNYSSNCDSFEYVGNVADNKVSQQKEALQASKDKNNLSVLYDPSVTANFKDIPHKETTPTSNNSSKSESKSISGSVSADIEKHLDLLQKLLNSKKVHPSKKQFYIRKLTKDISSFKDVDSNRSSGLFCLKDDKHKNDCAFPSELQSIKSSSPDTVGKCVTSSSNGSSLDEKKNNVHSKNVADRRRRSDFLMQFAKNERDYQINWIDNEISHLTKLKTVLELKNCKDFNKGTTNQTYVYKIMQNDGINKNSERDYVIQTKLDVATGKKIQYCLQGKKYSISDRKISNTWRNSNENLVNADIKIHAEERQTNIKVSTSCRICNQEPCVCKSDIIGDWTDGNTAKQYDRSELHTRESGPKICADCLELKCICNKAEPIRDCTKNNTDNQYDRSKLNTCETDPKICDVIKPPFDMEHCNSSNGSSSLTEKYLKKPDYQQDFVEQTEFQEYDLPQHFNSLQKIFQKCCCTIENRVCNCLFVRNLVNRLLPNDNTRFPKDVLPSHSKLKTNVATTDVQCNPSSDIWNPRLSRNPSFGIYKTTQTTTQPSTTTYYADCNHQKSSLHISGEKYSSTSEKKNANNEVECDRCTGINVIQNVTNNKGPTYTADKVCSTSRANIKCTNIGVQTSVDWLEKIKHPTKQQDAFINTEDDTRTEVSSSNLQQKNDDNKFKDISVQTSVTNLNCLKEQQNKNTNENISKTGYISCLPTNCNCNEQHSGTTIKEGVAETKELKTNCNNCNKQQGGTTTEGGKGTRELSINCNYCNRQPSGLTIPEGVSGTKELSTKCSYCNIPPGETITTEGVTETKELSTNCNCTKQQSRTTTIDGVTGTKELSTNCNKQLSGTNTTEGVTGTKGSNSNQTKIDTGVRECWVGLLKKLEHGNRHQTQRSREELVSKTDGNKINLASNKDVSSQTSDQGHLKQERDSAKGSGHLKEVTTQTSKQIKTKTDVTSDETLTSCSCAGGKSSSISTSVFDSLSNSPKKLTCRKKRFVGEVTTVQNAACTRCDNRHIYTVKDIKHQQKRLNNHRYGHCNVNGCTRKSEKSSVISQGVAYNLIIQEPIPNRSEKHVTSDSCEYLYLNKAKHGTSENGKGDGDKNQYADPSKNDKYQVTNDYNGSQLELLKESQPQYTIRDYLMINRPKFIYSAENRRQSVLSSRIFREHQKNDLKLQFLENNLNKFAAEGAYKLFTEREMKDITKKNYKKLPEIQKKISDLRKKRLRGADKLICDLFAKKVQKSALKGQWNFPIDKTITNLHK